MFFKEIQTLINEGKQISDAKIIKIFNFHYLIIKNFICCLFHFLFLPCTSYFNIEIL